MVNEEKAFNNFLDEIINEVMCKHNNDCAISLSQRKKMISKGFSKEKLAYVSVFTLPKNKRVTSKLKLETLLELKEKDFTFKPSTEVNCLQITSRYGFRQICFYFNNNLICTSKKFDTLSDSHKISYHLFTGTHKLINANFLQRRVNDEKELKKRLSNMGIASLFANFLLKNQIKLKQVVKLNSTVKKLNKIKYF